MPRISLWKDGRHSNDYKFMDRRISELFTMSGTGVLVHKYLGTRSDASGGSTETVAEDQDPLDTTVIVLPDTSEINIGDTVSGPGIPACTKVIAKDANSITLSNGAEIPLTEGTEIAISPNPATPTYLNESAQNIQDLLFLENRDRIYDKNVYSMRGIYQVADQDFDLSQFGLFLATGTLFMVFHINDMLDLLGRKIMNGDVLELQHLMDYDVLDEDIPAALKRFYVVSDCSRASEGYGPHWWPHLWRAKLNPLVDSQEYKDIIDNIQVDTDGDGVPDTPVTGLSNLESLLKINDSLICQAGTDVPRSGYDTSSFYIRPLDENGEPIPPIDENSTDAERALEKPEYTIHQYLTGDGLAPNGWPVVADIAFPADPKPGDYCLRTDYEPKRLFRYDGVKWTWIEDVQRTIIGNNHQSDTQLGGFMHNTKQHTVYDKDNQPVVQKEKQSISKILRPTADN